MNQRNPLVSVLVATFNGEKFIASTLDSILAQSYTQLELLVCDDGSTDGTVDILRSYGTRIHWVRQENQGVSAARNKAALEARGSLIAFLDQDDLWEPDLITKQVECLLTHPDWGYVYADSLLIDSSGNAHGTRAKSLNYSEGWIFEDMLNGNFVPLETVVMRATIFQTLGGFCEDLWYLEDYDLCLRAARHAPVGMNIEALARYRIHDNNLSHNREQMVAESVRILEELPFSPTSLSDAEQHTLERIRSIQRSELAWLALRQGDVKRCDYWMSRVDRGCGRWQRSRVMLLRALLGGLPQRTAHALMCWQSRTRLYGVPLERP